MHSLNQTVCLPLCITIFAAMTTPVLAETITINCNSRTGPDNTIRRGFVISLENNRKAVRNSIQKMAADGFTFMMGHRKLNLKKENGNADTCGYPEPEIYRDKNGDYRFRVDRNYAALLKTAAEAGLDILPQLSGTPPDFPRDPRYKRISEAERIANSKKNGGKGSKKGEPGKEFELPKPELWNAFADVVSDWMKAMEKDIRPHMKGVGDFGIVWIGTEEVAHTIGLRVGVPESENDKAEHIERYIAHWSKLARAAKAKGLETGGFQLNASNAKHFMFMAKNMLLEEHLPPLRFITLQNYKADEKNRQLLTQMRKALATLRAKRPDLYGDTRLLFNRYGWDKRNKSGKNGRFNSAMSIRMMLDSEKHLFDHADICYGYGFMAEGGDRMTTWIYPWMNRLGKKRHAISGLPARTDAFAFSGEEDVRIALWNNGKDAHTISVKLKNCPDLKGSLYAMKGTGRILEGKEMKSSLGITWDADSATIRGIELPADCFILITLE